MSKKTISLIAIILGVIVSLGSLTADLIGIGSYPGLNWAQLTGIAIGLILILLGVRLRRFEAEKEADNKETE
jgi:cytochrome c biogenesis protein CcdA